MKDVIPFTPSIKNIGDTTTRAESIMKWKTKGMPFTSSMDVGITYEWETDNHRNCGTSAQGLFAIDNCFLDLIPSQKSFSRAGVATTTTGQRNTQYVYAGVPVVFLDALKRKILDCTGITVGDNGSLTNVVIMDGYKYWNLSMEQPKSPVKFLKEISPGQFGPSPPATADYSDAATIATAIPGSYHATLFCSVKIVATYITPEAEMVRTLPTPISHHFTFTLKAARLTGKAPDKVRTYSSALDV